MINLGKKLQEQRLNGVNRVKASDGGSQSPVRASIRDRLLMLEVPEMHRNLPSACEVNFPNSVSMHIFELVIRPEEGIWAGGTFRFHVSLQSVVLEGRGVG